jgi:hypothetical protein
MMPAEEQALEVFQDLSLRGASAQLDAFRVALIERVAPPWTRSEDEERRSSSIRGAQDVLVLYRQPDADAAGAKLFLWRNGDRPLTLEQLLARLPSLLARFHHEGIWQQEVQRRIIGRRLMGPKRALEAGLESEEIPGEPVRASRI